MVEHLTAKIWQWLSQDTLRVTRQTGPSVRYLHPLPSRYFYPMGLCCDWTVKSCHVVREPPRAFLGHLHQEQPLGDPQEGRDTTLLTGKHGVYTWQAQTPTGFLKELPVTRRGECHLLNHQHNSGQLALLLFKISSSDLDKLFSENTTRGHPEMFRPSSFTLCRLYTEQVSVDRR